MATRRFLKKEKLERRDVASDDNSMGAPDTAMLCAVAQHDLPLQTLWPSVVCMLFPLLHPKASCRVPAHCARQATFAFTQRMRWWP